MTGGEVAAKPVSNPLSLWFAVKKEEEKEEEEEDNTSNMMTPRPPSSSPPRRSRGTQTEKGKEEEGVRGGGAEELRQEGGRDDQFSEQPTQVLEAHCKVGSSYSETKKRQRCRPPHRAGPRTHAQGDDRIGVSVAGRLWKHENINTLTHTHTLNTHNQ